MRVGNTKTKASSNHTKRKGGFGDYIVFYSEISVNSNLYLIWFSSANYTVLALQSQSTAEEYTEMPIREFGKAMLRGMGWNEGKAIGKSNKG